MTVVFSHSFGVVCATATACSKTNKLVITKILERCRLEIDIYSTIIMGTEFVFQWIPDISTYDNAKGLLLLPQITVRQNLSFMMLYKNRLLFIPGNLKNIEK